MKKITTPAGLFGPFHTVETLDDRYRCNGELDLPFVVVGEGTIEDASPEDFPPPPAPPVPVPSSVTMRQARLALLGAGLLSQVNAAIASMPSPQKEAAQIEWEYAATVERNSPLIGQLAPALGMTEAEMDQLFIEASLL